MSPSIWQLLIVLAIVLVLFGAKRLRNLGTDLGGAVKGFKQSMREGEEDEPKEDSETETGGGRLGTKDDTSGDHRFEGEQESEEAGSRK